ncbi:hypothetical protein K523DRAFT_367044 [Schizophyllum commune Tattone D]|nr:hypothetical protein K523DRAFT_367044 [Schizophyllum commune Tattone D]
MLCLNKPFPAIPSDLQDEDSAIFACPAAQTAARRQFRIRHPTECFLTAGSTSLSISLVSISICVLAVSIQITTFCLLPPRAPEYWTSLPVHHVPRRPRDASPDAAAPSARYQRPALISPRRVPPPRELGTVIHALGVFRHAQTCFSTNRSSGNDVATLDLCQCMRHAAHSRRVKPIGGTPHDAGNSATLPYLCSEFAAPDLGRSLHDSLEPVRLRTAARQYKPRDEQREALLMIALPRRNGRVSDALDAPRSSMWDNVKIMHSFDEFSTGFLVGMSRRQCEALPFAQLDCERYQRPPMSQRLANAFENHPQARGRR